MCGYSGNGTQDIFYDDPSVFYISLHGSPDYPHFTGSADEKGRGAGLGYNINVPLDPKTTTDAIYLENLDRVLNGRPVVDFGADIIIVSLGLDTWFEDPIAGMKGLQDMDTYSKMGSMIKTSNGTKQRPVLFVQEGGYTIEKLGDLVGRVLKGYLEQ
jgi:acetoin utilization deacetylase AcuC-like enzyme